MNLSVKNELKTLSDSVRFVVSSCSENNWVARINRERLTGVSISFTVRVVSGKSFDFSGNVHSGVFYSIASAVQKMYKVLEDAAAGFVTVVRGLMYKPLPSAGRRLSSLKNHLLKKVLFRRQAVLACAGGLRL